MVCDFPEDIFQIQLAAHSSRLARSQTLPCPFARTITTTHLSSWPSTTGVLVFTLTPHAWLLVLPLTLPWLATGAPSRFSMAAGVPSHSPMAVGAPSRSSMAAGVPSQ